MFKYLKFLAIFLIAATFVPSNLYAQTGKIFGKITDLETGEPLIGANILIEGTSLGAAANVDGEYLILNIPPGTYNIRASYIGYQTQVKSNVEVYVNLTSEINFSLPSEDFQVGEIVIRAETPLINKNITNSTSVVKQEDIENLPIRGVNAVVSTQAGIVNQGGNIYVRGSRADAVAFYVDGVLVNDPLFGGAQTAVINNAIEEIQMQAGGYSAEFGGATGGIISTQTRTGKTDYQLGFEAITDNFAGAGEDYLGGYSYGYSEMVFTAGGPVIPSYTDLRFFLAGSNIYQRSPAAFHEGVNYQNVYDPSLGVAADTFDVVYPAGTTIGDGNNTYQIQGNLSWDLNPFTFRVNANFSQYENNIGNSYFNYQRQPGLSEGHTFASSFKMTHLLSNEAFYDLIVNYFADFNVVNMDRVFKHDITLYGDSLANAEVGRRMDGDGNIPNQDQGYGWVLDSEDRAFNGYEKRKYSTLGGKFNLLYQIGKHHEFKTGAEIAYHTIRRYALPNPVSIATLARSIADGNVYDIYNRLDNYGYDVYGNETESGLEAPRHPIFGAFYIQDKMEFSDLVLNIGFRYDYIDIDGEVFKNPNNIQFNDEGEIDASSLVELEPIDYISPRIGISFPVTDRTVFHAQYGKFVQQSRLRDVYQGYNVVADNIKGGFAIQTPVGFGIRPEKTTQYEIGFKQQLGENFAFDITGFYKDIKDQIQIRSIFAEAGANHKQYYAWVNGDFSTTKGMEIKLDLRRTQRISATVDYTFSDAQGTGSNPSTSFRAIWQSPTASPYFPQQIAPLDFNQAHKGNINIDYRFGNDDGPEILGSKILSNFGVNLLFTFTSGFNYTRYDGFTNARIPIEPLNNSTTPWTFQLDAKIDKSFSLGPLNLNAYLWVINVLNTRNVVNVFPTSGDPYDDGFLASDEGQAQVSDYRENYGDQYAQLYSDLYQSLTYNSNNFGPPRQVRIGIRLNY